MSTAGERDDYVHIFAGVHLGTVAVDYFDVRQRLEVSGSETGKPLVVFDCTDTPAAPDKLREDGGVIAGSSAHLKNALSRRNVELIEQVCPERRRSVVQVFPLVDGDQHVVSEPGRI